MVSGNPEKVNQTDKLLPPDLTIRENVGKAIKRSDKIRLKNIENGKLNAITVHAPDFFDGTSKENSIIMNIPYDRQQKGKKA